MLKVSISDKLLTKANDKLLQGCDTMPEENMRNWSWLRITPIILACVTVWSYAVQ